MRDKILKTISTLDENNYQASLDWYYILHDYANSLAERTGLTLLQTSGVISALSPMVMFSTNLRDAERFCSTRSIANLATYKRQRMKALEILGAKTETEVLKILNGNKTKSFFLNIYKPQKSNDVCIDTHMLRFFGIKNITPKKYSQAANHVLELSKEMGIKPHQLQALIWTAQRGRAF